VCLLADAQSRGWGPPCPAGDVVSISAGGRTFSVHRKVAYIFECFIGELVGRGYPINKGQLDDWSYNCRKISGSTSWSNHAWGLAVDLNSLTNPMRSPLTTDMPQWVRDEAYLLGKYGLRWGGEYSGTPDPMHYEFMLTPAEADRIARELREGDDLPMDQGSFNQLMDGYLNPKDNGFRDGLNRLSQLTQDGATNAWWPAPDYNDRANNSNKTILAELAAVRAEVAALAEKVDALKGKRPPGHDRGP
jgi:D-alanyl-D-alanine carboxypeptidase